VVRKVSVETLSGFPEPDDGNGSDFGFVLFGRGFAVGEGFLVAFPVDHDLRLEIVSLYVVEKPLCAQLVSLRQFRVVAVLGGCCYLEVFFSVVGRVVVIVVDRLFFDVDVFVAEEEYESVDKEVNGLALVPDAIPPVSSIGFISCRLDGLKIFRFCFLDECVRFRFGLSLRFAVPTEWEVFLVAFPFDHDLRVKTVYSLSFTDVAGFISIF
jgi:hypothetical protein